MRKEDPKLKKGFYTKEGGHAFTGMIARDSR